MSTNARRTRMVVERFMVGGWESECLVIVVRGEGDLVYKGCKSDNLSVAPILWWWWWPCTTNLWECSVASESMLVIHRTKGLGVCRCRQCRRRDSVTRLDRAERTRSLQNGWEEKRGRSPPVPKYSAELIFHPPTSQNKEILETLYSLFSLNIFQALPINFLHVG